MGGGSHPQLPLFSGISAPTFPSRAGPGADTPAPPRRAPLQPPPPARLVPVAGSRRPCSGPRKGLGARGGWGGDAQSEPVGASPAPQSQQQTALGRTDARAEVRDPWRGSSAPTVPRPTLGSSDLDQQRGALQNRQVGPQGGALRLPTLEGARLQGDGYWVGAPGGGWARSLIGLFPRGGWFTIFLATLPWPPRLHLSDFGTPQILAGREGTGAKAQLLRLESPWEGGLRCACRSANRGNQRCAHSTTFSPSPGHLIESFVPNGAC